MKITAFGKVGEIGSASGKPVSVVAARFNQPSGITVIECDDKEHAVVADRQPCVESHHQCHFATTQEESAYPQENEC